MSILIKDFVEEFKSKKIMNTKVATNAIGDWINETLEIKTYLPFLTKREIVKMVIDTNTHEVNGVLRNDSISQYVSFVVAAITAHTNLEFDIENVYEDYDALAESGLLPHVIGEFKSSYDELDILLKMAMADKMQDNNINIVVAKFLNGILEQLDNITAELGNKFENFDLKSLVGDVSQEDMAKLRGFLDKYNK